MQRENEYLLKLLSMEDLAAKKTGVYAKLLMDVDFAEQLKALSARHEERKGILETLLYGEVKRAKEGGMSATKEEKEGK